MTNTAKIAKISSIFMFLLEKTIEKYSDRNQNLVRSVLESSCNVSAIQKHPSDRWRDDEFWRKNFDLKVERERKKIPLHFPILVSKEPLLRFRYVRLKKMKGNHQKIGQVFIALNKTSTTQKWEFASVQLSHFDVPLKLLHAKFCKFISFRRN